MKLSATATFTLVLLVLMVTAGVVSGAWGLVVGREALKGITQPDTRPSNNLSRRQGGAVRKEELVIIKESDILASVKERIGASNKDRSKPEAEKKPDAKPDAQPSPEAIKGQFPMTSQNQGVAMDITSSTKQADALVLKVSLRNNGKQSVQFLYSFLNVTDERGRTLSANTDGLPAELPANGETFSGTISIPTALLDKVEKVSLELSDYPDQQLQLQVSDIPVN